MTETNIVPFGKYKGEPVDTLLADGDYLRWVLAQPGLIQMLQRRYPALFNIITIGGPQSEDTPEHNRLQARLLDRAFQVALYEAMTGKTLAGIAAARNAHDNAAALEALARAVSEATEKLAGARQSLELWETEKRGVYPPSPASWSYRRGEAARDESVEWTSALAARSSYEHRPIPVIEPTIDVSFEHGFDVLMQIGFTRSKYKGDDIDYGYQRIMQWPPEIEQELIKPRDDVLKIEIKPQLGDDFPAVLRQIRHNEANVVLVGEFQASGATLVQVRQMFGERKIVLVSEVEALIPREME